MNSSEKSVAEFFAGIGLMRMGLEKAGWTVTWANDIDEDKRASYCSHFKDGMNHFNLGDVHLLKSDELPEVDLATASFPCNDLSLAGSRRGLAGKQSSAFWGFVQALKHMPTSPSLILLENVPGFLSSHKGKDFREVCLALNQLGYSVDTFIIDALKFVPQSRQRLFIVGVKIDDRVTRVSEPPSFYQCPLRPKPLADFILLHPEINWALRDLPPIPQRKHHLSDILEDIPPESELWWNEERSRYLYNQMSEKHKSIADEMIAGPGMSYGTVFRRVRHGRSMAELRTDGIAGCLRTPRGGSGRQILFKAGLGNYQVRLLTPRECARLMGADEFTINGPSNKALFGFGDAVCVPVIEWIAKYYLNPVWKELHGKRKSQRKHAAIA